MKNLFISLLCLASAVVASGLHVAPHHRDVGSATNRSFGIAPDGSTFLKDGKPHRVLSGSFHYFRAPAILWEERFATLKASGLNAISTYIAWNFHCPDEENECDFTGDRDIVLFVQLAQKYGLDVLLRPGPFICAEWDYGGFPAWMMRHNIYQEVRSNNPTYMKWVTNWYDRMMPLLAPYVYHRGGSIIMTQVENEYGTFANDKDYLEALRQLTLKHFGQEMLLYSADPADPRQVRNSAAKGIFQAVNFWGWPRTGNPADAWKIQAMEMGKVSLRGPPMNSEYYPGWISMWGDKAVNRRTVKYVTDMTRQIMQVSSNSSNLNFYVFFGGTNFGFWARWLCTTSYDYGAPMNESGHTTPQYEGLLKTFDELGFPPASGPTPVPVPLRNYGTIEWDSVAPLFGAGAGNNLVDIAQEQRVIHLTNLDAPLSMEQLNQSYGYILYRVEVNTSVESMELYPHDYAMIYFDDVFQKAVMRNKNDGKVTFDNKPMVQVISILIDNLGRQSWFGPTGTHAKGLFKPLLVNGVKQQTIDVIRLPMKAQNLDKLSWTKVAPSDRMKLRDVNTAQGTFFRGYLKITLPPQQPKQDTMLDLRNYGKGFVFVNGFNLGRYWSTKGPQYSYYCPRNVLRFNDINEVVVFEQEKTFNGGYPPAITFSSENYNTQMNL